MNYTEGEVEQEKRTELWFNKDGQEISGDNETFFAKLVTIGAHSTYYIRVMDGTLLDPLGMYARRQYIESRLQMKRVKQNTFDFYMMYLNTKNGLYLTKAQRGFLND